MRIGVAIEETWDFFNEIYADLCKCHQTRLFERSDFRSPLFQERVNRRLHNHTLAKFMRNCDVVFFEWASHLLAAATHLPKTCGIVTRLHRYEMYRWVDSVNWDAVDRIILVSEAKRREFLDRFPEYSDRIEVIPEAVSLGKYRPTQKYYGGDIGTLCHLTPRKRVYDLLMTFYELSHGNDQFHLHIAGGSHPSHGDYYVALQHAIDELDLHDKVTLYGNVVETWDWYHNIDIFVSNSYSEGLQVAPMEAMASGCFCLVHRWDGANELMPEENLYFSGCELRRKLHEFADLPEQEKRNRKARMREIAEEKFNIDNVKIQVRQVIEEVGGFAVAKSSSGPAR